MHCLGHAVLLVLHLLEPLHSFCPLFHSSLSPERRDAMETSHLWLSVFKFLHPLYIVWLWIFMFSFICCIKKLLRWCLTKAPSLEFCYLLCPFSRIVVFGFFLGSWPGYSQILPYHAVGMESNQITSCLVTLTSIVLLLHQCI